LHRIEKTSAVVLDRLEFLVVHPVKTFIHEPHARPSEDFASVIPGNGPGGATDAAR
jgi:hypothetical protein